MTEEQSYLAEEPASFSRGAASSGTQQQLPNAEELVYVLEKQDEMMSSLLSEVAECRRRIDAAHRVSEERRGEQDESAVALEAARSELRQAQRMITVLQEKNDALDAEIRALRSKSDEQPSLVLTEMRTKLRDAEFERERAERRSEEAEEELRRERLLAEQLRADVEVAERARRSAASGVGVRNEQLLKELADQRFRAEEAEAALEKSSIRLEAELEVATQRATFLETQSKKMADELAAARRERGVLLGRIAVSQETNIALREKAMIIESSFANPSAVDPQVKCLLDDQNKLIAMLKQECQLFADRMKEIERSHRERIREFKKEKRELEARIEKILEIQK